MPTDAEKTWFESLDAPQSEPVKQDVGWFKSLEPESWKYNYNPDSGRNISKSNNPLNGIYNSAKRGYYGLSRSLYTSLPEIGRNLDKPFGYLVPGAAQMELAPEQTQNFFQDVRTELNRTIDNIPQPKQPESKYSGQWFANSLSQMAPSLVTQYAMGTAAGPVGFGATAFVDTAGQQYEQAFVRKKSRGLSDEEAGKQAAREAVAVGTVSALIDAFGYRFTIGALKNKGSLEKLAGKNVITRLFAGGLSEGVTEGAQDFAAMGIESVSDLENYITSENFRERVLPSSVLGFVAGGAMRGATEVGGRLTDTPTQPPQVDERYSLTADDAARLVQTNPESAQAIAESKRASVNDFSRYGIDRGEGNAREARAQRVKFQEEVKRQLEGVQQSATANPETTVLNQNQTDVPQADAQATQDTQPPTQSQTPQEIGRPNAGLVIPFPAKIGKRPLGDVIKTTLKKASSLGVRTPEIRQAEDVKMGRIQKAGTIMQWMGKDFENGVLEVYKQTNPDAKRYSDIPQEELARLSDALNDPVKIQQLPQPIKEPALAMRKLIDDMSQDAKQFQSADMQLVFDENMGKYTVRSYRIWDDPSYTIDDVPKTVIDNAVQWLQNNSDPNLPQDYDSMRKVLGEYIASRGEKKVMLRGMGPSQNDLTSLLKKQEIPKELRDVMGEYKDPVVNFQRTVLKLAHMIETYNFQNQMVDIGMGNFLWEQNDASRPDGLVVIEPKGVASEADRQRIGPLAGKLTTPEMRDFLLGLDKARKHTGFMKAMTTLSTAVKVGKTMGSLGTQLRNIQSGVGFLWKNGINPVQAYSGLKQGLQFAFNDVVGKSVPEARRAKALEWVEQGITGQEVTVNELNELIGMVRERSDIDRLFSEAGAHDAALAKSEKDLKWLGKKAFRLMQKMYLNGDTIWKIAQYEVEKDRLRHRITDEAELRQAAAEIVKETSPTYDRVYGWVKPLRRNPFVATFPSFAAEMIRNNINIAKQARKEIIYGRQNGDMKSVQTGMMRLAGLASYTIVPLTVAMYFQNQFGITDEEDKAVRALDPPWSRNSFWFYIGRDENGYPIRFDLSYLYTDGNILKPMIALAQGRGFDEAGREVVDPFLSFDLHTETLLDVARNYNPERERKIYDPNSSPEQIFKDAGSYYFEKNSPGLVRDVTNMASAVRGDVRPDAKVIKPYQAALNMAGWKMYSNDPTFQVGFVANAYRQAEQEANSHFTRAARTRATVSKDELVAAYLKMEEARKENFRIASEKVQGAVTLADAQKVFTAMDNLSRESKVRLIGGSYAPWQPTEQFFISVPSDKRRLVIEAIQEAKQLAASQDSQMPRVGMPQR